MKKLFLGAVMMVAAAIEVAATESPYTGQEDRGIKALSQQEIDGYLDGSGMGYAKAAELNEFPGPKHVLDPAGELALTHEQTKRTQARHETVKSRAVVLGRRIVEKETELDGKFADGSIEPSSLEKLITEIALLEAQIRHVHLNAHLEQKALLDDRQIRRYAQLRGYQPAHSNKHGHSH
jgi:hypothetical protein